MGFSLHQEQAQDPGLNLCAGLQVILALGDPMRRELLERLVFFLTNLKALLEHGIALRETGPQRAYLPCALTT
jgi:hypothetical protein